MSTSVDREENFDTFILSVIQQTKFKAIHILNMTCRLKFFLYSGKNML
jgi:hypothetical protein